MMSTSMLRRTFLIGIIFGSTLPARSVVSSTKGATLTSFVQDQFRPKLITLGRGITSPMKTLDAVSSPNVQEISLEAWLVCNGAQAHRETYQELFELIGVLEGAGDGTSTFNLPTLEFETKGSEVVRGWAICPRSMRGCCAAELMPFDVESNI
jgi:Phage Tail Collar Domain